MTLYLSSTIFSGTFVSLSPFADRLLVDDHRARKVARLNGIKVIGSFGVLLRAKESGLVPEIRPFVIAIQAAGVHFGDQLVDEALRMAGERGVPS